MQHPTRTACETTSYIPACASVPAAVGKASAAAADAVAAAVAVAVAVAAAAVGHAAAVAAAAVRASGAAVGGEGRRRRAHPAAAVAAGRQGASWASAGETLRHPIFWESPRSRRRASAASGVGVEQRIGDGDNIKPCPQQRLTKKKEERTTLQSPACWNEKRPSRVGYLSKIRTPRDI